MIALDYARRGWAVFPCAGKVPAIAGAGGVKLATTDEDQIRDWWDGKHRDCNVGIAAGASGLLFLDIDPRHGGDESLRDLVAEVGDEWPNTPEVITGSGGTHLYFLAPDEEIVSRVGWRPGIDIRAGNAYVIAPGSKHPATGQLYEWEISSHPDSAPVPQVPPRLLALLPRKGATEKPVAPSEGSIGCGQRNATLTSLAGAMRRRGATEAEILAALERANHDRCDPPMDSSEVARIAASVAKYEPEAEPEQGTFAHALANALAEARGALSVSVTHQREPLFESATDLFGREFPPTHWRVNGLITEGGVAMCAAEPKGCKTWAQAEMGVAIATGTPAFGEFRTEKGRVAYFFAEDMGYQVRNRLRALLAARGMGPADLGDRLHVCPRGRFLDITRDEDLAWVVASCRNIGRIDVLILDPLRDIHSAAEDKSDDMREVMRRLRLLGELLGCTVAAAHHTAKAGVDTSKRRPGQRMRGSGAIHGSTDSGIYISTRGGDGVSRFELDVDSEVKGARSAGRFRLDLEIEDDDSGVANRATWTVNRGEDATTRINEDAADDDTVLRWVWSLADSGHSLSKTALREHGTRPLAEKRCARALDRLLAAGKLEKVGTSLRPRGGGQ